MSWKGAEPAPMADARRWQARSGSSREDQFTRPPSFVDKHDSRHLEGEADWHGPQSHRHVAVATALIVAAVAGAIAMMAFVDDPGSPGASGPVAAQGDDPVAPIGTDSSTPSPADLGNVTVPPAPSLPPLPTVP